MECTDSSSSADGCAITLYGSDLVLVVLSVRVPTDLDISWTVLLEQAVEGTLKNVFEFWAMSCLCIFLICPSR